MNTIHYSSLLCSKLPYENRSTYTGCTRYRTDLTVQHFSTCAWSVEVNAECCFCVFSTQIFLVLGVIFITLGVTGFSLQWRQEWPTLPLSLLVQYGSHSQGWSVYGSVNVFFKKQTNKQTWFSFVCVHHVFLTCTSTSWQATGPFLQFGAAGALILLSPFIFRGIHMAPGKRKSQTSFKGTHWQESHYFFYI